MTSFWITAALITICSALWLTRALWRKEASSNIGEGSELQIYRDQLAELESDVTRGVLSEDEAEASRVEVQRRLLRVADAQGVTAKTGGSAQPLLAAGLAALLGAVAFGTYFYLGAPGFPDQPRQARLEAAQLRMQTRPSQETAEARFGQPLQDVDPKHLDLLKNLRSLLASGGGDERGYRLYIQQNLRLGRYREAYDMQRELLEKFPDATKSGDLTNLAEYMIFAAGGFVSPEAEDVLVRALQQDASDPRARYFSGLMAFQNGRPDYTLKLWGTLQREGHTETYWMADINERIGIAADLAGQKYEPPTNLPGPSREEVESAAEMSPEDRAQMIEGMVAGLAERLMEEGGTIEEWLRLIRAYGVLGRTGDASAAWARAREAFADDTEALARLRKAAQDAEVAQ